MFLDEAHVDEGLTAGVGGADEVVGAPGLTKGGDEGTPGDAKGVLGHGGISLSSFHSFVCLFQRSFVRSVFS